jgi:hypothetical protein
MPPLLNNAWHGALLFKQRSNLTFITLMQYNTIQYNTIQEEVLRGGGRRKYILYFIVETRKEVKSKIIKKGHNDYQTMACLQ